MCLDLQPAFRRKEAYEMSRQRMLIPPRRAEFGQAGKLFALAGVERDQEKLLAGQARDAAAREDADGEVDRNCSGMEQVQGPKIQGTTGQIRAAGRLGRNSRGMGRGISGQVSYSVKKCAIWRNFL